MIFNDERAIFQKPRRALCFQHRHVRPRKYPARSSDGSLPTSEVKRRMAQLVLGWGPAW